MKETELRARYVGSRSPDHEPYAFVIEKRTNSFWCGGWKIVERIQKIGNATAKTTLADYLKEKYDIVSASDNVSYKTIKI